MKLVGATNWFVRGPFMLEGLICGLLGSLAIILLLLVGQGAGVAGDSRPDFERSSGREALALHGQRARSSSSSGSRSARSAPGVTLRRFLQV